MLRSARHAVLAPPALVLAAALLLAAPPRSANAGQTPKENVTRVTDAKPTALDRIQRSVARIDREASTPEGEAKVLARLSAQLRVSPDSLQAQHEAWGLGYGEVAMVYGFARASKRRPMPPEQVVAMRRDGADWEAIAKDLGVKVDQVAARVRRHEGGKPAPSASAKTRKGNR